MGKSAEEILFRKEAHEERAKFVETIQQTTWNTQLRTAAESLLIIYDQMLERLAIPVDGYRWAQQEFAKWIAEYQNPLTNEYAFTLNDGNWYLAEDKDGDEPIGEEYLYKMFLKHAK